MGVKGCLVSIAVLATLGYAGKTCGRKYLDKCGDKIVSDSYCVGTITSIGKEGFFWPSYEGTIAIGGEDRSVSQDFSLDNEARNGENIDSLAKQLYHALETRATVKLHETKPQINAVWRSLSPYHVDKVEIINK